MKKIYKTPITEVVNIKLNGTVLEDNPTLPIHDSKFGDDSLGKENNLTFEDDAWDSDPWSDGGNTTDPYDLWGDN